MTSGTIAGTSGGAYVDGESNGNGINVSGSAIHVNSRAGYAGGMNISISGGTLSSNNGYAIDEVSGGGSSQISSLSVTGGSFPRGPRFDQARAGRERERLGRFVQSRGARGVLRNWFRM